MPQDKDKCANCGATYGIHNGDTDQCPTGGVESPVGKRQRWSNSTWRATSVEDELRDQVKALTARVQKLERQSYTDLDGRNKGRGREVFTRTARDIKG